MFFVFYLWSYVFNGYKTDANEYKYAVISHIIQTKVNAYDTLCTRTEMHKRIQLYTEMNLVIQKHLLYS